MTDPSDPGSFDPTEPVTIPISDSLDLHFFRPKDVGPLVKEYLFECHRVGIQRVRLIHGKGVGNLRRTVHKELDRHPLVLRYELAGRGHGDWGATVAVLEGSPPAAMDAKADEDPSP